MPPEPDRVPPGGTGAEHPFHLEAPYSFSQAAFDRFAELSGDHNPIHVDAAWAARTAFGATVAHGMLLFSRLRALMAHAYPGLSLHSQDLMFPAPTFADEDVVLALDGAPTDGDSVELRVQVRKPDGRLGLDGSARLARAERPAPAPADDASAEPAPDMAPAEGLPRYQALRIGQHAEVQRSYSRADIDAWAALAGQHIAPADVPEPLIAALYSYLLGEHVPGHGTNYLKQRMRFHAAARAGEQLRASVRITRLRPDKALVNLDTPCTGEGGRALCGGDALVRFAC